jgi:thioredoxin reductase (NADPH)
MSSYLIQQVRAIPNLSVKLCTSVVGAEGDGRLERLVLEDAANRTTETATASHLFVFIGAAPLTEWLEDTLARDRQGFVLTGPDLLRDGNRPAGWRLDRDPFLLESSVPGVFAAGDVRSQSVKRVASAVGEGAMAVTLVHKYLERA